MSCCMDGKGRGEGYGTGTNEPPFGSRDKEAMMLVRRGREAACQKVDLQSRLLPAPSTHAASKGGAVAPPLSRTTRASARRLP